MNKNDEKIIDEILKEENMDHAEYKYQWSAFLDPQHQQQRVIRTDDKEEYDRLVEEYRKDVSFTASEKFPNDKGPVAVTQAQVIPDCPIHGSPMKWIPPGVSKKTGKAYSGFWSCQTLNADGTRCSARPTV